MNRIPTPTFFFAAMILLVRSLASATADPFADEIVVFTPGTHAGFGTDRLPGVVLGPPQGSGSLQGSTDTLALGDGGVIVMGFDSPGICDRPGPDFIVFENAFHAGAEDGPIFDELGIVAVSTDGIHFVEIPYNPTTHAGLAGRSPVLSNSTNGIDPTDPTVAGGDPFDLADVGIDSIRFVRITDAGSTIDDTGNHVIPANSGGFDLDAIAAIHPCDARSATATPSPSPTPVPATLTPSISPTRSPTAPSTSTPTVALSATPSAAVPTPTPTGLLTAFPTSSPTPPPEDIDRDGHIDEHDLAVVIHDIFLPRSANLADVNHDGTVSGADCTKIVDAMGRL